MGKVLHVSPNQGNWKVHWENDSTGQTYSLKETAIKEAKKIVRSNPQGYVSQIKVQRQDGTFQIEWTYGRDPYPPAG